MTYVAAHRAKPRKPDATNIIAERLDRCERPAVDSGTRHLLVGAAGAVSAVLCGWQIAHGDLVVAGFGCGLIALWSASRLTATPADVLLAGGVLTGYLVGGRGFAQLSVSQIPMLPGELALGAGLIAAVWRTARNGLTLRPDALSLGVVLWLIQGLIRLPQGIREHGLVAIRDFATVYYAMYFLLALGWGARLGHRRWITGCLDVGFVLAGPALMAFQRWPDLFIANSSIQGIPLIFIKGDVASALLVAGTIWLLHRHAHAAHRRWLLPAMLSVVALFDGNSRGGVIGLAVAALLLALGGDRKVLRPLLMILAGGLVSVVIYSALTPKPWTQTSAHRLYEWTSSMTDLSGTRSYQASELGDKPDNNQFRMVWWRSVFDRTMSENPWWGLGFGYDLANDFRRNYYGQSADEDFTARSPHNFVLTVFGRMGALGLFALATIMVALIRIVWRNRRQDPADRLRHQRFTLAVGAAGIFASACFGVVLEGPMGAVVFWTALGLANSAPDADHVKSPQGSISKAEEAAV